jgi:ribosomal protein S17E
MNYESQRVKRINSLMKEINETCDSIYEALIDEDFDAVRNNLRTLSELIDYVRKSISNEI